jgi:hypothetical protein
MAETEVVIAHDRNCFSFLNPGYCIFVDLGSFSFDHTTGREALLAVFVKSGRKTKKSADKSPLLINGAFTAALV